MKVKIKKERKTSEIRVEYYNIIDKTAFRFGVLQKVIKNADSDISLLLDTNQLIQNFDPESIEEILQRSKIRFESFPIKENSERLLGIKTDIIKKKKNKNKKLFILDINQENFSREVFEELFQYCDLAFGIEGQKTREEISDIFRVYTTEQVLFNKEYFKHSIYDSIFCMSIRSSIDIQSYFKE